MIEVVEYRPGLPLHLIHGVDSGDNASKSHALLFVNGLGDSLLSGGWFSNFAAAMCQECPFSLIAYVTLRSHHGRFGLSSLVEDAEDIDLAISHLSRTVERITLMGHSTGCQGLLTWQHRFSHPAVQQMILQGGVSDYEAASMYPGVEELRQQTTALAEDCLIVCMDAVVRMSRFRSLFVDKWGVEDMFHSQRPSYPDLQAVKLPCLILYAQADEYVPPTVDKEALLQKFHQANPTYIHTRLLPTKHDVSRPGDFEVVWRAILSFHG